MYYAFANSLGRPYVSGLDADAKAYIDAIVAAGATVTGAQKTAISDFVVAEKDASRWTGLKRFYLPVWGVAAANAVCLKSLTSGTFVGGVTHGAGYVQGNGTTGYFNTASTPSSLGISSSTMLYFGLLTNLPPAGSFEFLGGREGLTQTTLAFDTGDVKIRSHAFALVSTITVARASQAGIYAGTRVSNTSLILKSRNTAGTSTGATNTTAASDPSTGVIYSLAVNASGVAAGFYSGQAGLYGVGLGLSAASTDEFTLNLKTLWETVTGLTLP